MVPTPTPVSCSPLVAAVGGLTAGGPAIGSQHFSGHLPLGQLAFGHFLLGRLPLGPPADPALAVPLLIATIAGCALGTCSGLVPGLHANNFALLLTAAAPTLDVDPLVLGAAMLAAGVVHTFLDVVPALAIGVPDAAMAATALPGHRLVLEGRGREALRLSAVGSGLAVAIALPLSIPVTWAMVRLAPTLYANLPLVIAGVVIALLVTDSSNRARLAGLFVFAVGAALGVVVLPLDLSGPLGGSVLAPLFGGLFGAPVLLDAMDGAGIPPQADPRLAMAPRSLGGAATAGALSGAAVGYLPGVSAAVAAVVSLPLVSGDDGARSYLVAASGANTSNAVFALFALVALGTPRTGVLVAVDDIGVPLSLGALLPAVVVAGAVGFVLVTLLGDTALRVVGRTDARAVSLTVLSLVAILAGLFAGVLGLAVLAVATLVGLLPPRLGTRRVYLMGVLLGPIALATT